MSRGWIKISPTAQQVILAASATVEGEIMSAPGASNHSFLDSINIVALQVDSNLT